MLEETYNTVGTISILLSVNLFQIQFTIDDLVFISQAAYRIQYNIYQTYQNQQCDQVDIQMEAMANNIINLITRDIIRPTLEGQPVNMFYIQSTFRAMFNNIYYALQDAGDDMRFILNRLLTILIASPFFHDIADQNIQVDPHTVLNPTRFVIK